MTSNVYRTAPALAVTLVLIASSNASAQASPQVAAQVDAGHSVWRDTLIGLGIGTGAGLLVGKMRQNFHNAECRVLDCHRVFETDTLAPLGAAMGSALGFVVHRLRHGGEARPSAAPSSSRPGGVTVAPSYSRTRKVLLFRAEF